MTTKTGAWVDLAMGDLGQLANTFWQLIFLPAGHSRWSLVTPPGFADNGGLVSARGWLHGCHGLRGEPAHPFLAPGLELGRG